MSIQVSSSYIQSANADITGYPVTIGAWVYPTQNAATNSWANCWSAGSNVARNEIAVGIVNLNDATFTYGLNVDNGNEWENVNFGASNVVLNAWAFMVARFISDTNRRIAIVLPSGSAVHAAGVTYVPVNSAFTRTRIGQRADNTSQSWVGNIAEVWYTNTDIQVDGLQLENELLWRLALCGPFSVRHIAKDIISYRSLRIGGPSDRDRAGEIYTGALGRNTWTASGTVTQAPHPPLSAQWRIPGMTFAKEIRIMAGKGAFVNQRHYRFRTDADAVDATPTWGASEDSP